MLQWFKKISQGVVSAEPQQPTSETASDRGGEPSQANQPLNDRDYEFLFTQLLEGVSHGWQPIRIQRFFEALEQRGTLEQWIEWLQRYGAKVLTSSASNTTLARRMVALGELTKELPTLQQLGETSSGIGRLLLARSRPDDADTWQYEESPAVEEPTPPTPVTADPPTPSPAAPPTAATSPATTLKVNSSDATPLTLSSPGLDGKQTISLDELMVRLQEDESLVQQVAQRLGLDTSDPHAIIQELVRQINQRNAATDTDAAETADLATSGGGEAERAFNLGVQQYEAGDYEGAIAFWDQAIELKPDYYQAWGNRGLGLKNLKRYETALESYERALAIQPDFYKAWYNQGLVLDELHRHSEAIAAYDKVLEIKPDFHKAWYSRGISLESLGDISGAINAYGQAIATKADFHKAWLNRGNGHRTLEQYTEALRDYDQALNLKGDDVDVLCNRGGVLCHLGQYAEAIESYTRALERKPNEITLLWGRGDARVQAGELALALKDYGVVLELKPNLSQVWYAKGHVLQQLGWEQEAQQAYQEALQRNEELTAAWQGRGQLSYQQRDFSGALEHCDQSIRLQADVAEVWHNRGQTLLSLGRVEEAIASLDRSLQLAPDQWQVWCDRAEAAAQSSTADLLLSSLSTVAQQHPTLNQRGQAGQIATLNVALNSFDAQQHPEAWGQVQRHLGDVFYHKGEQKEGATEHYQQALDYYQQAQQVLDPQATPQAHLALLQSQMLTELALEEPQQAQKTYQQAKKLLEDQLSAPGTPVSQKRPLALQMTALHQLRVDAAIQLGELTPALEYAEYSRNFALAWLWERLPLQEGSPRWSAIQRRLDDQTAIVYWHLSPAALTTFLVTRQAPEPIVLGRVPNVVLNVVLSPALRARVESAKQNSNASLELLLELLGLDEEQTILPTPAASSSAAAPEDDAAAHHRLTQFQAWFEQWQQLLLGEEQLQAELPNQLEQLRQLLQVDAIVETLQAKAINHVILIPHQGIHEVPVQALFPDTVTVTSLPSLRLAQPSNLAVSQRPALADPWLNSAAIAADDEDWLSLGLGEPAVASNSTEPGRSLLYGLDSAASSPRWDVQLIALALSKGEVVEPITNTVSALTQRISADYSYIHWLCPAVTNPHRPQQSRLQDVPSAQLTITDLASVALNHCELWSLDQPEQWSVQYPPHQPDSLSVSTALLSQGVTYVLRPLWPVDAPAHQLFMVEFYRCLAQGSSGIVAHKQAQIWLRTITTGELLQWYQSRMAAIAEQSEACAEQLKSLMETIQSDPIAALNQSDTPFAHPYFWAGYVIIGCPF